MNKYRKCAVIVVRKDNLLFVGERRDIKNAWQFPQGGVNDDETFEDAAKRELLEETGIFNIEYVKSTVQIYKYDFPRYLHSHMINKYGPLKYLGQQQKFCLFNFVGNEKEINVNQPHPEFVKWKWDSVENIINNIVSFKRDIYRDALNELNLYTN